MSVRITYAITVCNEHDELKLLLYKLKSYVRDEDQILIQPDASNMTDDVLNVIKQFINDIEGTQFTFSYCPIKLDGDFGAFKNAISEAAVGDWIFQIDADEYPSEKLLSVLPDILNDASDTDVILVPRINTVSGITQTHIDMWNWNVSSMHIAPLLVTSDIRHIGTHGLAFLNSHNLVADYSDDGVIRYYMPVINFPDYQWRLYRNIPTIHWKNKVHEVLTGFSSYSYLPAEYNWCLMHHKDIDRQTRQNSFYETIAANGK